MKDKLLELIPIPPFDEDYWKNKTQWIDSELNSKEDSLTDEEYYRQQDSIRELMELNMVMYGKW